MPIETFSDIASLNENWPQGVDPRAEGDDHIRGIKKIIKADAVSKAQLAGAGMRNRIVNGAMQISQENADTIGTTNAYYAADQWRVAAFSGLGINFNRSRGPTPYGSDNMIKLKCAIAKGSLAAGDYVTAQQWIEGVRVADFRWGFTDAKPVILRFCIYASYAGTFSVALANADLTRCFIKSFTVAAGEVDTYKYVIMAIPGDTTGTWTIGADKGIRIDFPLAAGSTYTTATEGWQAGNKYATTSHTNGMATVNNAICISDVGLYLDPTGSGIPPAWEMPDEAEELAACQRYWQPIVGGTNGYGATGNTVGGRIVLPVTMRAAPSASANSSANTNAGATTIDLFQPASLRYFAAVTATGGAAVNCVTNLSARM